MWSPREHLLWDADVFKWKGLPQWQRCCSSCSLKLLLLDVEPLLSRFPPWIMSSVPPIASACVMSFRVIISSGLSCSSLHIYSFFVQMSPTYIYHSPGQWTRLHPATSLLPRPFTRPTGQPKHPLLYVTIPCHSSRLRDNANYRWSHWVLSRLLQEYETPIGHAEMERKNFVQMWTQRLNTCHY